MKISNLKVANVNLGWATNSSSRSSCYNLIKTEVKVDNDILDINPYDYNELDTQLFNVPIVGSDESIAFAINVCDDEVDKISLVAAKLTGPTRDYLRANAAAVKMFRENEYYILDEDTTLGDILNMKDGCYYSNKCHIINEYPDSNDIYDSNHVYPYTIEPYDDYRSDIRTLVNRASGNFSKLVITDKVLLNVQNKIMRDALKCNDTDTMLSTLVYDEEAYTMHGIRLETVAQTFKAPLRTFMDASIQMESLRKPGQNKSIDIENAINQELLSLIPSGLRDSHDEEAARAWMYHAKDANYVVFSSSELNND